MKSIQTSSTINTKAFDTTASINLRPPPIDRHKSFDEDDFSKKPIVVKKANVAPTNVTSYSVADLQMATGSFSVENLLGGGSLGRVYRAQFDDGKVCFLPTNFIFRVHGFVSHCFILTLYFKLRSSSLPLWFYWSLLVTFHNIKGSCCEKNRFICPSQWFVRRIHRDGFKHLPVASSKCHRASWLLFRAWTAPASLRVP